MANWINFRLAKRARRIHAQTLLGMPNVSIVFTGTKIKAGVDTGRPAVVVGVEKKLKEGDLKALRIPVIPLKLGRVSTDVIETHRLKAPPGAVLKKAKIKGAEEHRRKFRPKIPGGVSAIEWCSSACTVTCHVWSHKLKRALMLDNFHCARLRQCRDGFITQPSPMDGGIPAGDNVAQFLAGDITNETTDSALNEELDQAYATKEIFKLGAYRGYGVPSVGDRVIKSGRTSGVTTGTVQGIDGVANIDYGDWGVLQKRDLIVATKMLDGGDSSSSLKRVSPDGTIERPLMGQGFAGSDLMSLFIKIPNIIEDPALKQYDLDFDYDFEDGNGGGEPEPPTCPEQFQECVDNAKGDLMKSIVCLFTYWRCLGVIPFIKIGKKKLRLEMKEE